MAAILQTRLDPSGWTVAPAGDLSLVPAHVSSAGRVPATLPGCVHRDLLRAGLIGHPAIGENEGALTWIGLTDWEYQGHLSLGVDSLRHERIDLVLDGVTGRAELEVNGRAVGSALNAFRPHRFDLRPFLSAPTADCQIRIRMAAPVRYIHDEAARLGARPVNGDWDPYVFVRSPACAFGWDWGPRTPTCGVLGRADVESWSGVRIIDIVPIIRRGAAGRWTVDVGVRLEFASRTPPGACVALESTLVEPQTGAVVARAGATFDLSEGPPSIRLVVDDPALWWPAGMGEPNLYELAVQARVLTTGPCSSPAIDRWSRRVGFRTATLETSPGFRLRINDRTVFCKGANWIPDGLWASPADEDRILHRVQQAADANMNMLRVWGGGRYECERFYSLCDSLGILVWQDFMFSCGCYPEEEPLWTEVDAEARYQVARLAVHPSVALWCGGNECTWGYESWEGKDGTWKSQVERLRRTWGRAYYFDLLPKIVGEIDPSRPYWPNSPWSADPMAPPNDQGRGDSHIWNTRGDGYRGSTPAFCSEFGQQSPSNYATLFDAGLISGDSDSSGTSSVTDALISPGLAMRQRGPGGNARWFDTPIGELFRRPTTFDEWHFLAQLVQARALRTGVEWFRANSDRCAGALIWQLNDAWPGLSWSLIDSAGSCKPAYAAVRDAFRPRLLTVQPRDGIPTLIAVNDTDDPWHATGLARRIDMRRGAVIVEAGFQMTVPPRACKDVSSLPALIGSPTNERRQCCVVDANGSRATWFHSADRELLYPPARIGVTIERDEHSMRATVTARSFLRDVRLSPGRLGLGILEPPEICPLLLPGESFLLSIAPGTWRGTDAELAAEIARPPCFQAANSFHDHASTTGMA